MDSGYSTPRDARLNQADSDLLARSFAEAGYQVVDWTAGADVMLLNSCTVTATADAKARQALRAARRANSNALVVATGCYAQRAASELSRLKDDFFGGGQHTERTAGDYRFPGPSPDP